jgi:hypothetical protein
MMQATAIPLTNERTLRQREVDNAVFVQVLFGRPPSAAVRQQLQRYVNGELNRETAFAELYGRQ